MWFKKKKINKIIIESIKPCNGNILKQLYEMMHEAPEFFYSSLNHNKAVQLRDIAHFR